MTLNLIYCITFYTLLCYFYTLHGWKTPNGQYCEFWKEHFQGVVCSLCMRASLLLLWAIYNVDDAIGSKQKPLSSMFTGYHYPVTAVWVCILLPVWLVRRKKLFWSKAWALHSGTERHAWQKTIYTNYVFLSLITKLLARSYRFYHRHWIVCTKSYQVVPLITWTKHPITHWVLI